ncbi:hypothetical protein KJZ63_04425 [Patescibacteria group bacterium]|nr:hypothetical protein [Patescibacteria group bacterium]
MNWKVLLAGAIFILVVFAGYLSFQFVQNRQRISSQAEPLQMSRVTVFENGVVPPNTQEAAKAEVYSQTVLIRGEVTQYNQTSKVATVAVETKQLNGQMSVIGLLEVSIDPKLVKEFSCWPSAFKTPTGQEISIRDAYMPISTNSILYIKDEVKKPIAQINQYLTSRPFAFILLTSSPTDAQKLLEDTTGLATQLAKDVAILGCN